MSASEKDRFTVTMKKAEVEEIAEYVSSSAVPRNELVRRATLAYIRREKGQGEDVKKLFQQVGSIDQDDVVI